MAIKNRSDVYKAKEEILKAGTLFNDLDFNAENTVDVVWVRPTELSTKPTMAEHPIILDIQRRRMENGPFVAAFATIGGRKDLVAKIFPDNQNFSKHYCGLFFFQFWKFGDWEIVAIDDKLPYSQQNRNLIHIRAEDPNEFFISLLEKAYAKFKGGYEAVCKMRAGEVLVDLTGGVSQTWNLSTKGNDEWFPILKKLADAKLPAAVNMVNLTETKNGITWKTTYLLQNMQELTFEEENRNVRLVCLCDPWGTLGRYTGSWNNEDPKWKTVPQHIREKLVPREDGTRRLYCFWMTYGDFMDIFSFVHFCVLSPEDMGPVEHGVKWIVTSYKDAFPRYIPTVSNIRNAASTLFEIYPQYQIELTDIDNYVMDGQCELVVSLMQRDVKNKFEMINMGFSMFPMKSARDKIPLKQRYFEDSVEVARSGIHTIREITCRFRLPPGMYVLVVVTSSVFKEREFLLRIYKHQRYKVWAQVVNLLNELEPSRKKMIPPSSRLAPVGPYDGPIELNPDNGRSCAEHQQEHTQHKHRK